MSLRTRIARLEAKFVPAVGTAHDSDPLRQQQQSLRALLEFIQRVPADLRPSVAAMLADPDRADGLAEWVHNHCAPWAAPPPELPRALIEWVLAADRRWYLGHNCETCGLAVPLRVTWENDPDPPTDICVFPLCPLCGGVTGFRAYGGPSRGEGVPRALVG